ncbi:spore germination protein GerPC [Terrilactibacillus sp. S3-3]|nr:spore germination protein GerPC [Terrilactibacillus sp. S3-3]
MNPYQQPAYPLQALAQINRLLVSQDERIRHLEETVNSLKQSLKEAHDNRPTTVNYSFDQLKIDTLEGTLNIGLSPKTEDGELSDFMVTDQTVHADVRRENEPTRQLERLETLWKDYLQNNAIQDLMQIENERHYPLDDQYRQLILNDIHKQLPPRAAYYLKKYQSENPENQNEEQMMQDVNQKVIEDIRKAFHLFFDHLPRQKGG